jgi:uncharacterized membrane protein YfcA
MDAWLVGGGLAGVGLVAGFVDAIAGGGGLLTVPALLLTGLPTNQALGTNKGQSVFGTAMALGKFWVSPLMDRRRAAVSFIPALAAATAGTLLVTAVPRRILTPLVMTLLTVAAVLVIVQRPSSKHLEPRRRSSLLAMAVAFALAFYDGFFGPGTGTFLIIAYTYLWREPLDAASANAKVVNFCSNFASMAVFALKGLIVWTYALPMMAGQIVGGWLGAHVTIRVGRGLVRWAVVVVSLAMIGTMAKKLITGG